MKHNLLFMLAVLALAIWAAPAQAAVCKGVTFPDQAVVDGQTLALNGLGLRLATAFKVNVYVAGLYVPEATQDAQAILDSAGPRKLVMHFLRKVGAKDLNKAWEKGFADNAGDLLPALKERTDMLISWMSDMAAGQQMVFTFRPDAGLEVDVNGTVRGTIQGDDFARVFLSIWLGDQPPNPELKAGLLGGACD